MSSASPELPQRSKQSVGAWSPLQGYHAFQAERQRTRMIQEAIAISSKGDPGSPDRR